MAVALVAVAAVVAVLVFAIHHGRSSSRSGCIDVTAPSTMGGVNIHACGRDAARLCGSEGAGRGADLRHIRAACRRAGY